MEKFELILKAENGVIETNAKELLRAMKTELKKYNYVVDRTNYSQAKQDRATLNNLVEKIANERKRMEEKAFGQWKKDKKDLMDLEKTIKSSADDLGIGIKALDEEDKERKEMALEEMWYQRSDCDFNLIMNPKWLNKSASEKTIKSEMEKIIENISLKRGIVDQFLPTDEYERERVLSAFNRTLDPIVAKAEAEKIQAEKLAVEKSKSQRAVDDGFEAEPKEIEQSAPVNEIASNDHLNEVTYHCQFTVHGTREQLVSLQKFLNHNQIYYGVDRKWTTE